MATPATQEITRLLVAWSDGDQAAPEKLIPVVYDELRRRSLPPPRLIEKGYDYQS